MDDHPAPARETTRRALPASALIHYRIAADPRAHRFEVRCTVLRPDPAGQRFRLPTWIPGSYLIREFARHVIDLRAERGGVGVSIIKEAKDRWRVAPGDGPVTVIAQVFALDLSVRGAYLDTTRGFFNGACVFLCPEGFEASGCVIDLIAPTDPATATWQVATTLTRESDVSATAVSGAADRVAADARGFGRYGAESYDELIDHPVEMGCFDVAEFAAGGVEHRIALTGTRRVDLDRVSADLARICRWQIEFFHGARGRPPFDRYLFLVHATNHGHGGLEHRASTSLLCSRDELPLHSGDRKIEVAGARAAEGDTGTPPPIDDDYLRFLGLASHEYFHAWNVKRIKPAAFVPYDLAREAYTRQLWIFEGITSYYDDLALLRCGLIDAPRYLELIGRSVTTLLRTPGRSVQALGDASFDAWIKHYRPDAGSPNATVSYYLKGSLAALALDLTLRRGGRTTLDDVMREMWRRYGVPAIGVPEEGFRNLVEELAGASLVSFFAEFVDGTSELPLDELFDVFGVDLHLRSAGGNRDRGGTPPSGPPDRCWFGATVDDELALRHVHTGGPAERAGLVPGDVVIAVDGIKASAEGFASLARKRSPGERVEAHAFRRDALSLHTVELSAAPRHAAWLTLREAPPAAQLALRRAWLDA